MKTRQILPAATALLSISLVASARSGPVAHWSFDEGRGRTVKDDSGNKNHGTIHGAKWVKLNKGFALEFDGWTAYVDCGNGPSLDITGPITLEAWVMPLGKPSGEPGIFGKHFDSYLMTYYGNDSIWWYIGSGTNHSRGRMKVGRWNHVVGTFDGKLLNAYVNGQLTEQNTSKFPGPGRAKNFLIGCAVPDATAQDPNYAKASHFKGRIDEVRVYDRALSHAEIAEHFRTEAGDYGFKTTWFNRLKVTPYYYFDRGRIVVELDYTGMLPLTGAGTIELSLVNGKGGAPLEHKVIANPPAVGVVEAELPTAKLKSGSYALHAVLKDESGARPTETIAFDYPPKPVTVAPPARKTVGPLPAKPGPVPFQVEVGAGGGFRLLAKGGSYPFVSRISWPNGDFNRLIPAARPYGKGEKSWKCRIKRINENRYEVAAGGDFYTIQRRIDVFASHVYIKDTYTNTTDADLGLLIYNEMPAKPRQLTGAWLGGYEGGGRKVEAQNASVFVTDQRLGMGIVPMDDVFVIQSVLYAEKKHAGIGTENFALAPGKSYTLEWAVYPTGTGKYYDFINTFRRVEGRIGTIDGGAGFFTKGPFDRRQVPTSDYLALRGMKYGFIHCLSGAADDPEVSIEGIEFMDFPKERALLKKQVAAIKKQHPDFKVVFHVAASLYATNNPDKFPDSKVIDASGKQVVWADPGFGYISKKRQADGWRWYIYYPTPGNSFHNALLKSADVMMDEIGTDGAFMDGFFVAYRGRWTYDGRWDGHSAEIDLKTKTIKRKVGSVLLLSQPSLIEFCRKVRSKGGFIIANNSVITRSIANEKYIIHDQEVHSGPQLHLAPSVTALANASSRKTEKDIYLDVLDKLKWGELFMYYQEGEITYPSLPAKQYPMTFVELYSGAVIGKQRIVTMNPGVYGWPGDRHLHMVYKFDGRGAQARHDFITTVDQNGVRTAMRFKQNESAVIERIPVTLKAAGPVNVIFEQYGPDGVALIANGRTAATLRLSDGAFPIRDGATYTVTIGPKSQAVAVTAGALVVSLDLSGQTRIEIRGSH